MRETIKQEMLLTKEEIKLIERLRQLRRNSEDSFVIVKLGLELSWWVTSGKDLFSIFSSKRKET